MDGRFTFLIGFLASWAWQALGKIPNPATRKAERDLPTAKQIIDILEMIREKTKGNLSGDEDRALETTLAELRLNYVDESSKPSGADEKKEPEKEQGGAEETETKKDAPNHEPEEEPHKAS